MDTVDPSMCVWIHIIIVNLKCFVTELQKQILQAKEDTVEDTEYYKKYRK